MQHRMQVDGLHKPFVTAYVVGVAPLGIHPKRWRGLAADAADLA